MAGIPALQAAAGRIFTWLTDWNRRHDDIDRYARFGCNGIDSDRRLRLVEAFLARSADPNGRITTSAMLMNYIGYPRNRAFEPFACGIGDLRGATPLWVAAFELNRPARTTAGGDSYTASGGAILEALLAAVAYLYTYDRRREDADVMAAAIGIGRTTYTPREPRGIRSPGAEAAVRMLLEAGAEIDAVNEADFTALHGAAFRRLNEVVQYLVAQGADIDARDFRGRTTCRMAEGSKQTFQFQSWPETTALLARLGANTRLGIPGNVQERPRDVPRSA